MQHKIMRWLAYSLYHLLVVSLVVDANINPKQMPLNVTINSTSSPWLRRVTNPRAQALGCWNRPWVCTTGLMSPRRLCCMNRCVDITTDPLNCGFCGVICPFTWRCCDAVCINVNISPFHCGQCWNRCPPGRPCNYGMCGYAQAFPRSPGLPGPPLPFPPGLPGLTFRQSTKQPLQKY